MTRPMRWSGHGLRSTTTRSSPNEEKPPRRVCPAWAEASVMPRADRRSKHFSRSLLACRMAQPATSPIRGRPSTVAFDFADLRAKICESGSLRPRRRLCLLRSARHLCPAVWPTRESRDTAFQANGACARRTAFFVGPLFLSSPCVVRPCNLIFFPVQFRIIWFSQ